MIPIPCGLVKIVLNTSIKGTRRGMIGLLIKVLIERDNKVMNFIVQTHLSFGREFTEAVEAKQVGELCSEVHTV